jgi:D-glycero-D-manno-heptose 1,7-bisphosphate phosphatase
MHANGMMARGSNGNGDWLPKEGPLSAVMLDRDGVINRELGRAVRLWREFEFLPGVLRALQQLAAVKVPVLVVSNQSAIGRGWVDSKTIDDIHERMVRAIHDADGRIDDVVICPHAPHDGCPCRKPRPGMLFAAAQKHGFALDRALMVGDAYRDVQAAQAAGAMPVMLRSGHAIPYVVEEQLRRDHVPVVPDLATVVEAIIKRSPVSPVGGERQ